MTGAVQNHEPASHYKDMTKTLLDLHRIEGLLPGAENLLTR